MTLKKFVHPNIMTLRMEMGNIEIPHKSKSLSLFHINACSLNKNFDDLHYLSCCMAKPSKSFFNVLRKSKKNFEKAAMSILRIMEQFT